MKISNNAKELLIEALRRNEMFVRNNDRHELLKPMYRRWLGLGTLSAYKAALDEGLMQWHNGTVPYPRTQGWLTLTPKGVRALRQVKPEFEWRLADANAAGYQRTFHSQYQLAGGLK